MRDLAILTFVTLDGVMQAPSMPNEDRSGGFRHGGWAAPYWQGVMEQVQREAMASPYDMLFGRKTYEMFASHWSTSADSPVTRTMNAARKFVVTSKPDLPDWSNGTALTGDIAQSVSGLKAQDGPLLQIHGSWQLIQKLLIENLIDEFRLWTFPVLVGSGKRLFENGPAIADLRLIKSEPCQNGAVMTVYRRD